MQNLLGFSGGTGAPMDERGKADPCLSQSVTDSIIEALGQFIWPHSQRKETVESISHHECCPEGHTGFINLNDPTSYFMQTRDRTFCLGGASSLFHESGGI